VYDLEADAATLTAVAERLSVSDDPIKRVVARGGELVARLKTNGRLNTYSPLSRLLELEMLLAGIDREAFAVAFAEHTRHRAARGIRLRSVGTTGLRPTGATIPFHAQAARDALASSGTAG